MTPRHAILILCLGLAAGCTHFSLSGSNRTDPPRTVTQQAGAAPVAPAPQPWSPYAAIPTRQVQPPTDTGFTQVGFPHSPPPASPPAVVEPVQPPLPPGELQAQVQSSPVPEVPPAPLPDEPIVAALRSLLHENRPDRALEILKAYDPATQELLLGLLPLAVRVAEGGLSTASAQDMAHLLDQLTSLEESLRARVPLTIPVMCFCRSVNNSFANYTPLPASYKFRSGSGDTPGEWVHLYVELRNVSCKPDGEFFDTCLRSRLEIFDWQKKSVYLQAEPAKVHRSRSLQHDFFLQCHFEIPAGMPPGAYTLSIQVEDDLAQPPRTVTRELDFRVSAHGTTDAIAAESGDR